MSTRHVLRLVALRYYCSFSFVESVMTYMGFLGLTAGIRDPHVFDVPSICTKAQTLDPVSIWLHQ